MASRAPFHGGHSGHARFEGHPADARPGGIHAPTVDLNGDRRMDVVALISQQYEHVVASLNRGVGKGFRAETLFRAPVPVWGSSGIQMVDMDKDADLDLLMTNGDSLVATGTPDEGIAELERASRLAPETPEIYVALAQAYASTGRVQDVARARAKLMELTAKREARPQ